MKEVRDLLTAKTAEASAVRPKPQQTQATNARAARELLRHLP